ncbi:hypothetical protein [Sulfuriferula sp.]|uniref:hypothetical protein n=1 Tax=Sulfuriferula sp. TaxID=2025307 RepID=UPI002731DBBD|nr:hypothetical protein [Sulfuriferula sp.]MDP2026442.1 hypothetical protein [Sulfuriferula sp.]
MNYQNPNGGLQNYSANGESLVQQVSLLSGEDVNLNRMAIYKAGNYKRLTATGAVKAGPGVLIGFYVASTNLGTITLYDNSSNAAPQISGVITPAVGWNEYPAAFATALYAAIGGTALDVTFIYV